MIGPAEIEAQSNHPEDYMPSESRVNEGKTPEERGTLQSEPSCSVQEKEL